MATRTHVINIDALKVNKIYSRLAKIHKYWSRKPWFIIDNYIKAYSRPGDTVLDPFMGSGSTGLEAIISGRDFIGYDLNPFAVFLTQQTLDFNFDDQEFLQEFLDLEANLKKALMDYYEVKKGRYLLYAVSGPKNTKPYNAVTANYDFAAKEKLWLKATTPRSVKIPYDYPDRAFPIRFYKDRFSYKGVRQVSDLFTKRNLACLSILHNYLEHSNLKYKDLFRLTLSNTLLHVSKLKSENIRPLSVNNYWLPDDYIEENVWWRFADRVHNLRQAKQSIQQRKSALSVKQAGQFTAQSVSALDMSQLKANSIDYIFTDPPYGDAIQYSELSYVWNTWLGKEYATEEEVIINPVQHKNNQTFIEQLDTFLQEAWRVLKRDKYLTLCFQNKNIGIWVELASILRRLGFELVDVSVYDTLGSPYNKSWAKYSPKSDFYITFKKPAGQNAQSNDKPPISTEALINRALKNVDKYNFSIGRAYDEFVLQLIKAAFEHQAIIDAEKLNLKTVINLFEKKIPHGNIQQRLFQDI